MNTYKWPLTDKYRTVQEIKFAVDRYYTDLKLFPDLARKSIEGFYNFVKNIPYSKDADQRAILNDNGKVYSVALSQNEIVSRPKYLLTLFKKLDCKKKTVLMASFMRLRFGPSSYRYCLSSNRPDRQMCHIFTQIFVNGEWINADATYARNRLRQTKSGVTNFEAIES